MFGIIFVISLFIILLLYLNKFSLAKKTSIFLLFLFAFLMSFGKNLGRDYGTYLYNYEINYYSMFFSLKELLWSFLFIVFKTFKIDFFFLMFFIKITTVYFYYLGLKNLKLNDISMTIAILLYIFVPAITFLNIVRQGLALSIYFYAYSFIRKLDLKKFVLWSLISFNIHFSILYIFLVTSGLYFFKGYKKKLEFKYLFYLLCFVFCGIIALILINSVYDISFFNQLFNNYTTVFNDNLSIKNLFSPIVIGNALINMVLILKEYTRKNEFEDYQLFSFIGVLLNCISLVSYIFDRIGILFSFYNPYMVSQIITNEHYFEIKENKYITFFILLFYCLVFFLNVFVYKESNSLIYEFYF